MRRGFESTGWALTQQDGLFLNRAGCDQTGLDLTLTDPDLTGLSLALQDRLLLFRSGSYFSWPTNALQEWLLLFKTKTGFDSVWLSRVYFCFVWLCVALCVSVWLCVSLCGSVWLSVAIYCSMWLFVSLCRLNFTEIISITTRKVSSDKTKLEPVPLLLLIWSQQNVDTWLLLHPKIRMFILPWYWGYCSN